MWGLPGLADIRLSATGERSLNMAQHSSVFDIKQEGGGYE